ncbi:hypothetical protein NMYAN_150068 [Nitrosomonas nitrosa]|uniref:Uncharacterized protein n=1 Tax=Nitrosomonas nitrosa TaxID=52442 RepID=A0A8H8Z069_9PROT|nr:hypothetical protein NMYAN_150068 [Nitrosomonas nitrosa]
MFITFAPIMEKLYALSTQVNQIILTHVNTIEFCYLSPKKQLREHAIGWLLAQIL